MVQSLLSKVTAGSRVCGSAGLPMTSVSLGTAAVAACQAPRLKALHRTLSNSLPVPGKGLRVTVFIGFMPVSLIIRCMGVRQVFYKSYNRAVAGEASITLFYCCFQPHLRRAALCGLRNSVVSSVLALRSGWFFSALAYASSSRG